MATKKSQIKFKFFMRFFRFHLSTNISTYFTPKYFFNLNKKLKLFLFIPCIKDVISRYY